MTDPTPQRDQPPREDRPVMGDHSDLEEDEVRRVPADSGDDTMARLLVPGLIVLVIAVAIIGYFLFFD